MQDILGKVFDFVFTNFNDADLKDRAYYFYNLLKSDIEEAEYIICGERATVDKFISEEDGTQETIFNEFNSLSVIYNKPEEKFVKKFIEVDEAIKEADDKINKDLDNYNENEEANQEEYIVPQNQDKYTKITYTKNSFDNKAVINDQEFKSYFDQYTHQIVRDFNGIAEIEVEGFVEYLESEHIFVKAHKEEGSTLRMFLYSKDVSYI